MLVSIIIPNYNHESFLKQRIESVLNQTFQDFELIILDDCSADNSRKIIEQYRNHPMVSKIILNSENSGSVFRQWIKGIENSKGEFIWIAESDDYAAENFLEETQKVLKQDDSLGLVFTNSNTVDAADRHLTTTADSKSEVYSKLAGQNNRINKENVASFLVSDLVIENASCALFRKKNLMELNFDELRKFTNTGDRFSYIGIALSSNIQYVPQTLNFMRSHEGNTTKKSMVSGKIHNDRLRVLNYYFSGITQTAEGLEAVAGFYREHYLSFIYYGDYKNNKELLKKVYSKKKLTLGFYRMVGFNLFLFKKLKLNSKILKGIYYRILLKFY